MNLMEIYRSINDFSSGPHRILCPLQVHTTQQIKKKILALHRLRQKKNCSTGPCAIITNTYCCKKINSPVQKQGYTNQLVSIYILFSFLFFFFVDLWSSFFLFQKLYTLPDECVNFMLYISWGGVFCLLFACTTQSIHQFQLFNIKFYSK